MEPHTPLFWFHSGCPPIVTLLAKKQLGSFCATYYMGNELSKSWDKIEIHFIVFLGDIKKVKNTPLNLH